jgi:hypothetical protein
MSYPSSPLRTHQIDVVGQVGAAYQAVFERLQLVAEMALLPFLLIVAAEIVESLLPTTATFGRVVIGLVHAALLIVFATAFSVRWYRFLLLGETIGTAGLVPAGWAETMIVTLKLIAICIGFIAVSIIPAVIIGIVSPLLMTSLMTIGVIALALLGLRVLLAFPAAAIQRPVRLRTAWGWIAGNYWRLFACGFACNLPFVVAGFLIGRIAQALPSWLQIAFIVVQLAVSFASWAVIGALAAHLYRDLVIEPD